MRRTKVGAFSRFPNVSFWLVREHERIAAGVSGKVNGELEAFVRAGHIGGCGDDAGLRVPLPPLR